MKLCSKCQFIYEDDQERCDMDGAELVYEPTLDHVFPNHTIEAAGELNRPEPMKLIIPLAAPPRPEAPVVSAGTFSSRRVALQIAAVILIAVVAFVAFYATRRLLQPKTQPSPNFVEKQTSKSLSSPVASAETIVSETAAPRNAELEASPRLVKLEARHSAHETTEPAPGFKPLPRLKPLPTLKPLPRLSDQTRRMNASQKGVVVTARPKPEPKKESRLGSFLKKTGRALTRPFKT